MFDGDAHVRHIDMNVPHRRIRSRHGMANRSASTKATLVVDTIGLNARTFVDAYRTPHTEKLHVVERWRLIEGGNNLEVHVTVTDPDTFNQPWQAMRRYEKGQGAFPEGDLRREQPQPLRRRLRHSRIRQAGLLGVPPLPLWERAARPREADVSAPGEA